MKLSCLPAIPAFISLYLQTAQAIPTWDMFTSRQEIGQIVPGSTIIHAITPGSFSHNGPQYLRSMAEPGVEANASVTSWQHPFGPPSRFFVSKGHLHQITNNTHILYADLVNATTEWAFRDNRPTPVSQPVFKLCFSKQKNHLVGGSWEWSTTMLQVRLGQRTDYGLFYHCTEPTGDSSIYIPMEPGQIPGGCKKVLLHSFVRSGNA